MKAGLDARAMGLKVVLARITSKAHHRGHREIHGDHRGEIPGVFAFGLCETTGFRVLGILAVGAKEVIR